MENIYNIFFMKQLALWTVFFAIAGFAACDDGIDEAALYDYREEPSAEYLALIQDLLEAMNMPRPADAYCYPVYPGMASWADLSPEDRKEAQQVPQPVVKRQSTQGLLQDIWEGPIWSGALSIFSFGSEYRPLFLNYFEANNAFRELQTRGDVAECILQRMERINPSAPADWIVSQAFEVLISQDEILPLFTPAQKKRLARYAYEKLRVRMGNTNITMPPRSTLNLLAQIMLSRNYAPFVNEMLRNADLQEYLQIGMWLEKGTIERIILCATTYLQSPF
jgi:hypothetical protein